MNVWRKDGNDLSAEDFSGSDSDVSYKEKFENIKYVMNQLQKDLAKEKLRTKGINAITLSLEEERKRNRDLDKEVKRQQRCIEVLQTRLETHGFNSSLSLEEGEYLRPQTSKYLLENLISENARLANMQKYISVDPAEMEKQAQQLEITRQKLDKFKEENKKLREELQKCNQERLASADDKDRIIIELQKEIEDLKQSKHTQTIICESLSSETLSLRSQLKDTMKQMQRIMQQMDKDKRPGDHSLSSVADDGELEMLKLDIKQKDKKLQEMDLKLKEVVDMNGKWQTYHNQREEHVKQLKKEVSDLKAAKAQHSVSTQNEGFAVIYKQKADSLEREKEQLLAKNQELVSQNQELQHQVKSLKDSPLRCDSEKIQLYEAQIKLITEDFRQERADRAREHERAENLQQELADVQAQLESLQRSRMDDFAERRQNSLKNYEMQYHQKMYGQSIGVPQAGYVARGSNHLPRYECDGPIDSNRVEDVVDVDSAGGDVMGSSAAADNQLQCPKCNKSFPFDKHTELLEHLDEC